LPPPQHQATPTVPQLHIRQNPWLQLNSNNTDTKQTHISDLNSYHPDATIYYLPDKLNLVCSSDNRTENADRQHCPLFNTSTDIANAYITQADMWNTDDHHFCPFAKRNTANCHSADRNTADYHTADRNNTPPTTTQGKNVSGIARA
jgi:hypothetical protein